MVDIGNYSSIYHLHIPRTSGVFMRGHILREFMGKRTFATHYSRIDDNILGNSYFVGGHFGTYPIELMSDPLVFSVLRDPVKRFISYFKYVYPSIGSGDPDKDFDRWISDESISHYQSNTQTKFLSNSIDVDLYNQNIGLDKRIIANWFIKDVSDTAIAKMFIDKHNVFIMEDGPKIYQDITNMLGVSPFPHTEQINNSATINLNISKKQYDKIEELNSLDLEVYDYARYKEKR